MGLFDTNDTETKAQKVAAQVLNSADNQARMISQTYKLNYNKIWKNLDPDIKPEDIIPAFGKNAVKLFTVTNESMALVDPDQLMGLPNGYTWTPNDDGSVDLKYTAPEPPPAPEPEPTSDNAEETKAVT